MVQLLYKTEWTLFTMSKVELVWIDGIDGAVQWNVKASTTLALFLFALLLLFVAVKWNVELRISREKSDKLEAITRGTHVSWQIRGL
jgi:hypothetical protein